MTKILTFLFAFLFSTSVFAQDWSRMPSSSSEPNVITPLNEISLPPTTKIQVKVILVQGLGKLVVQDESGLAIQLFYDRPLEQNERLKVGDKVQFVGYYDGDMFWTKTYELVEE